MERVTRKSILGDAEKCVCSDREKEYGTPEDSFSSIAALWNDYLSATGTMLYDVNGNELELDAHDVGLMMALLKISRIATGHHKADNYTDLAGYAACAGEIAFREVLNHTR